MRKEDLVAYEATKIIVISLGHCLSVDTKNAHFHQSIDYDIDNDKIMVSKSSIINTINTIVKMNPLGL